MGADRVGARHTTPIHVLKLYTLGIKVGGKGRVADGMGPGGDSRVQHRLF